MYQKYNTEALVLGSYESGENDRTVVLYTKDFGLVRARARSVRSEASRMRYGLQNYSLSHVSLVRGKASWRVAGAAALRYASGDTRGIAAFARVCELVTRLVHGEEENTYLYGVLAEAHAALIREKTDAFGTIEIVCVARVLFALGYISAEALETGHASFSAENALDHASRRRAPALRRGHTPISLFTHTAYTG